MGVSIKEQPVLNMLPLRFILVLKSITESRLRSHVSRLDIGGGGAIGSGGIGVG